MIRRSLTSFHFASFMTALPISVSSNILVFSLSFVMPRITVNLYILSMHSHELSPFHHKPAIFTAFSFLSMKFLICSPLFCVITHASQASLHQFLGATINFLMAMSKSSVVTLPSMRRSSSPLRRRASILLSTFCFVLDEFRSLVLASLRVTLTNFSKLSKSAADILPTWCMSAGHFSIVVQSAWSLERSRLIVFGMCSDMCILTTSSKNWRCSSSFI